MKLPATHDIVIWTGTLATVAYLFTRPEYAPVWQIASAFTVLAGGQALGETGVGVKRWLQGGSEAPTEVIKPATEGNTHA